MHKYCTKSILALAQNTKHLVESKRKWQHDNGMNVWKIGREPWKFQHFCCHAWFGEWVTRFSLMVFFTLVVTFFAKYPTLKYAPWCKRDNYQALLPQFINLGTSSKYKASCWEQAKVATQQWNENVWKVEVENLESFVRKAVASLRTPKKIFSLSFREHGRGGRSRLNKN